MGTAALGSGRTAEGGCSPRVHADCLDRAQREVHHRPHRQRRRTPEQTVAVAAQQRHRAHDQDCGHGVDQPRASAGNHKRPRHVWLLAAQLPGGEHRHDRGCDPQPVVNADELHQRMQGQQAVHHGRHDDRNPRRSIARMLPGQHPWQVAILGHGKRHARRSQDRAVEQRHVSDHGSQRHPGAQPAASDQLRGCGKESCMPALPVA